MICAQLGLDVGGGEANFVKARSRFDGGLAGDGRSSQAGFGGDVPAGEADVDQGLAGEEVLAAQQQGIDRVGRGLGRFPILGLLLFQEPNAALLDGHGVARDLVEGLDHQGVGLDGGAIPPPA